MPPSGRKALCDRPFTSPSSGSFPSPLEPCTPVFEEGQVAPTKVGPFQAFAFLLLTLILAGDPLSLHLSATHSSVDSAFLEHPS